MPAAGPPQQQPPSQQHEFCLSVQKLLADRYQVVDLAARHPCHQGDGDGGELAENER
jgi:hypothetical protein